MAKRRRRKANPVAEFVEGLALGVRLLILSWRFARRHPGGVLVGVVAYLVLVIFWATVSLTAGVLALVACLAAGMGISNWRSRERRRHTAAVEAQAATHAMTIYDLLLLTPREFEEAVADRLRTDGYRNVRVVGGAGDLAADVLATAPDGHAVVVQCKRCSPHVPVRSPELQKFIGMAYQHHEADEAMLVTTSRLTTHAQALANQHGVVVIAGEELGGWMLRAAESSQVDPDDRQYSPAEIAFVDHEIACATCTRADGDTSLLCRTGKWLWEQVVAEPAPEPEPPPRLRLIPSPPNDVTPQGPQRPPQAVSVTRPGREDLAIPMDVPGSARERYQQRYALLHQRYGAALPDETTLALLALFEQERRLEEEDRLD